VHGGGGHFGGGHYGGGHFGGGHYGGGHFGGLRGGSHHHYGYHHYYPGYGFYGYYPYAYDYYPYYSDTYPYAGSAPAYDYGYDGDQTLPYAEGPPGATFSFDAYNAAVAPNTASLRADKVAHMTVHVPADARVWFGTTKTTSTGSVRQYESPPLTPGSQYTYEIRARWTQNGQEVTQTQQVPLTAGGHVNVTFPVPPKAAG
jgi:uncharacterized protein (TIGR03000 family)